MWDEKVHPGKLSLAKERLEKIITGTSNAMDDEHNDGSNGWVAWKLEWQKVIREWSSKVTVHQGRGVYYSYGVGLVLNFPLPTRDHLDQSKFQVVIETISTTTTSPEKIITSLLYCFGGPDLTASCLENYSLDLYRQRSNLGIVPVNLLIWCISFFVKELGGCIEHKFGFQYDWERCENWQFVLPQHRFKELTPLDQGWIKVYSHEYDKELESSSLHYSIKLFDAFKTHLLTRTVENCFTWSSQIAKLKTALNFVAVLVQHQKSYRYRLEGEKPFFKCGSLDHLINGISSSQKLEALNGELSFKAESNDPTNFWAKALQDEKVAKFIHCDVNIGGSLDNSDVDWILHIFFDISHHIGKLKELITADTIANLKLKFPTARDHFQTFDFPRLRGALAESIPAIRLAVYSENVKTLHEQTAASTSSVPTAVVDIIGSYLPVF